MQTPRTPIRTRYRIAIAVPATLVAFTASAAVVHAYPPPPGSGSTGCTSVLPGATCNDTFTFGGTLANQPVIFTITGGVAGLSNAAGVLDAAGRATVGVTPSSATCSPVQVTATAAGGASIVSNVPVNCQSTGVLPTGPGNTGGGASVTSAPSGWAAGGASILVLLGAGVVASRRRQTSR